MSVLHLLEAAKIIEENEKIGNHWDGNGFSVPFRSLEASSKKLPSRRSPTYRSTHNQLEKNRRAHLRDCLAALRIAVPASGDSSKVTTLALLQAARSCIKRLEKESAESKISISRLKGEQQLLIARIRPLLAERQVTVEVVRPPPAAEKLVDVVGSDSACDEIDIENDDETGYHSGDDNSSRSSRNSRCSYNSH